ncbi:MAG: autotransporter-associated beta strand repeat-containing protein, partial [Verrucomicrobia bacterium]|nr:autotransporter-associated beta strand repeat-containing protein [Verrucomicrobiota bacterium]
MGIGSIEGNGDYFLGGKTLTVGGNDFSTTVSGVIQDGGVSGGTGGSLTKIGTGTLTLTGANTYTGGTAINAGTLQLGNRGTSGSVAGNILDNGSLAFDRSDVSTFGGVISGPGSVAQLGTGTTVLTANNPYAGGTTIASGSTLQLGNGGPT